MQKVQKALADKKDMKEVISFINSLDMVKTTEIHIRYISYKLMLEKTQDFKDEKLKQHFTNMAVLAGLHFLKAFTNVGYDAGYFSKGHDRLVDEAYKLMLESIRPQAIPLVELYSLPDEII